MSNRDDKLHEMLSTLEEGIQPENVLKGEDSSSKVADLVYLAASIRNLAHPKLDQQSIKSDKRRLFSAAREKYQMKQSTRSPDNGRFNGQWLFVPAIAGVAVIVLMIFVLAAGVGLYFSGPRGAQAATLVDATGLLEVSDTGLSGDWHPVTSGDEVRSGQRLRTGEDSWVTLQFFDGTQTTLSPNTDMVLERIDGNWGNELQVELIQNRGETNHDVVPLQGDQGTYQVLTPSGEASVRGTSFKVLVEDTGASLFAVESGEVLVSNNGTETYVGAGQGVVTELGKPLGDPKNLVALHDLDKVLFFDEEEEKINDCEPVAESKREFTTTLNYFPTGEDPQPIDVMLDVIDNGDELEEDWLESVTISKNGTVLDLSLPITLAPDESVQLVVMINLGEGFDSLPPESKLEVRVIAEGVVDEETLSAKYEIKWVCDEEQANELFFFEKEEQIVDCEPVAESKREFTTTLNYVPTGDDPQPIDVMLQVLDNGDELEEGWLESVTISKDGTVLDLGLPITLAPDESVQLVVTINLGGGFDRLPPESKLRVQVVAEGVVGEETLRAKYKIKWVCDEEKVDELFFFEEEERIVDCEPVAESKREFTTTLNYVPTGDDPQPIDVMLQVFVNGDGLEEDWLESVTISKDGTVLDLSLPITLAPDESVQLVVTINLGEGFDSLPPENKLRVQVVAEGVVDEETLSATYEIKWVCDEEIPDEAPRKDGHYCTTDDIHPHAWTLFQEYGASVGVTYDEIMDWFCEDNLGFGEIELGFKLYLQYEALLPLDGIATIYDIFELRLGGMGWGQVKHKMASLTKEALADDEPALKQEKGEKKEPPGKEKSEQAKDKEKPNKKKDE